MSPTSDDELLAHFEDCTLPNSGFHHRDHVHVAWIYLRRLPPLDALARFTAALQRFARANGRPDLYHETITWAYLFLIHQRMAAAGAEETWDDFAARNADLLTWRPSILAAYYRPETLASDAARKLFLFPDLQAAG